jgi:hypothetical protein
MDEGEILRCAQNDNGGRVRPAARDQGMVTEEGLERS